MLGLFLPVVGRLITMFRIKMPKIEKDLLGLQAEGDLIKLFKFIKQRGPLNTDSVEQEDMGSN